MRASRPVWLLILLLFSIAAAAQGRGTSYAAADAHALRTQAGTVDSLAKLLTAPYKSDSLKFRALFRWVTANIDYDVYGYRDTGSIYKDLYIREGYETDSAADRAYTARLGAFVLLERKGICEGYSRLYKALCDAAGLRCEVVSGYSRSHEDRIGQEDGGSHAWNAILLGGRWQLLDATWGSGFCDDSVTRFTRLFDPSYYLKEPKPFSNDHHPDEPGWSLLEATPDRQLFFWNPFLYDDFYTAGIRAYAPAAGCLRPDGSRKVHVELQTDTPAGCLRLVEYPRPKGMGGGAADGADSLQFGGRETLEEALEWEDDCGHLSGSSIWLDYRLKSPRSTRLDVYLDGSLVMSYGIAATL